MLNIQNLSKNYGHKELFRNAEFHLFEKERVCLIAPNGSGKTTLLNILLKKDSEFQGEVLIPSKLLILSIGQKLPESHLNLFDFVTQNLPLFKQYQKLKKIEASLDSNPRDKEILEAYGEQQSVFEQQGGFAYIYEATKVLEGLGFKEQKDFHRPISTFSGGELRRALLVEVLIQNPDILILDEPTNHLDLKNILFLENFLKRYSGTVFFVSHDTEFINKVATHTMSIENYKLIKVKGGYTEYLSNLHQREELYEKKCYELKLEIQRLKPTIEKFKAGSRSTQAQQMQRRLNVLTDELTSYEVNHKATRPIQFQFKAHKNPFDPVLKIKDFNYQIEDRIFFKDLELTVKRGEKIAILAPNGTGKSLLLWQIIEAFKVKNSKIQYGQGTEPGFFLQEDQNFVKNYGKKTTLEYIYSLFSGQFDETEFHKYIAGMHLRTDRKIASLSGGEQSKLRILALLMNNPNFIILDEPTNHMDIPSVDGITSILKAYKGTIILITHNRQILKELNPKVYLLQEQQLKSMEFHPWNDIFNTLMHYQDRFDAYDQTGGKITVIEEIQKLKEENLEKEDKKKYISKEERQEIRKIERKIKEITTQIQVKEENLDLLKKQQFDESIYNNYEKASETQNQVNILEKEIELLFEEYSLLEEEKKVIEQ